MTKTQKGLIIAGAVGIATLVGGFIGYKKVKKELGAMVAPEGVESVDNKQDEEIKE